MDRKDLYRLTRALVDHCIASSVKPPAAIVLDVDHSDDPTYGQQEFAFYNHHYQNHCYLPLCIFEGTSHALVTAYLRPGTRPPGTEHAMILVRLLSYLRRHWPHTHILVRGDRHCATPEVIEVITSYRWTDCVFGLAGNAVLLCQAAPTIEAARCLHHKRVALARAHGQAPPTRSRLYDEFDYAAGSWAQPWRVILKAEVMSAGDNPRFVVTSLEAPTPQRLYENLYCARGHGENNIKAVKNDLHSGCTSATTFLANAMRLLLACAASVLCLPDAHPPAYRLSPGATLDRQPHPLQNGYADQTVQGQDSPPLTQFLPGQSAVTAGDDPALRRACACLQHVVSCKTPPAARSGWRVPRRLAAMPRSQPQGVSHGGRHAPERVRYARLQTSRPLARGTGVPKGLELHKKSPQYPLLLDAIHCSMCGVTVYEISRLNVAP